jgi:hypothetical protein
MFDESSALNYNSLLNYFHSLESTVSSFGESSDLITPKSNFDKFSPLGESNINLENSDLNSNRNSCLFVSQNLEDKAFKLETVGDRSSVDSLTGKTVQTALTDANDSLTNARVINASVSSNTNNNINQSATTFDAGNSLKDALSVGTLNGTKTYSESVSSTDTNDYYRFTLEEKSNFSMALKGLSGDADVQLLDSKGKVIQESDLSGTAAESVKATLDAGDYYARILPFDSSTKIDYDLSLSATPVVTAASLTSQWYGQNLRDTGIRNLTQGLAGDRQLSRNDTISIFRNAKDGGVINADELKDLRTIVSNADTFKMSESVRVLANKIVNGNVANQKYQGKTLGNLFAGSNDKQMENLIDKWFLGSDRPATKSGSHAYREVSGSLFQNGISANDIKQGQVGDCYYLSTLASVANEKSSYIQNMFVDNGDGTFAVRFFNNGVADYVTVDKYLPTDSSGRLVYAGIGTTASKSTNELWVALAEKAYAQLAESGWSRSSSDSTNSYSAIEGGWMDAAMRQVTSLDTIDKSIASMSEKQLINLTNSNKLLTAGFVNGSKYGVVNNHAYTITAYNASTGKFFLRNPWGSSHAELTWNQLLNLKAFIQWTNT